MWSGRRDDRSRVAGGIQPGRRDGGDSGGLPKSSRELGEVAGASAGRELHGELKRPVEPAAEARGEQVVGLARGVLGRVVAGVAGAEAQAEDGSGEGEEERRGCESGPGRTALDEPDPAEPEAGARLACTRAPCADASDAPAGEHQERRKERERSREHEQTRERSGDRDAVEEADAEREHAQQRDHDRGAGEEDRATGRVHRQSRRRPDVAAVLAVGVAVAGDDEERVVDADAEADHQRELGGEVGHVDEVAAEPDHAEPGAEAEQRGHDRQAHRENEPKLISRRSSRLRARRASRARSSRSAPARSPGRRARPEGAGERPRSPGLITRLVAAALADVSRVLVERDGGEADRAVTGDRPRAVRAGHAHDLRELRDPRQHRLDRRTHRGVGQLAVAGLQHDLVGVARLCGVALLRADPTPAASRCSAARSCSTRDCRRSSTFRRSRRAGRSRGRRRGGGGRSSSESVSACAAPVRVKGLRYTDSRVRIDRG